MELPISGVMFHAIIGTLRSRTASSVKNVMTGEGPGRVRRHSREKFGFKIYDVRRGKLQTSQR